jgi:hypothetical protein
MMAAPRDAAFLTHTSAFARVFSGFSQQLAIWALQHFMGDQRLFSGFFKFGYGR